MLYLLFISSFLLELSIFIFTLLRYQCIQRINVVCILLTVLESYLYNVLVIFCMCIIMHELSDVSPKCVRFYSKIAFIIDSTPFSKTKTNCWGKNSSPPQQYSDGVPRILKSVKKSSDLRYIETIGVGGFGRVELVRHLNKLYIVQSFLHAHPIFCCFI